MLKSFVIWTSEIDDPAAASQDMRRQLDENKLGKNSVGIISCHYEYVLSGVAKAVCEALPFDVVGAISPAQAVNDISGQLLLTILVLTGDDVEFKTTMSGTLAETPSSAIERAYADASRAMDGRPALILAYAGFMVNNFGDEYVDVLTRASGGSPCFGTLAVDDTAGFEYSYMIYNGEAHVDQMGLVLIYGDVNPRFYIATISADKIIDKVALITSSDRHILKELNGRPVIEFFTDLGLAQASATSYAMTTLPFMLDYNDGTPPVSKVFIGLTPENHAICAGVMPEGSSLYMGVFDRDDVLLTTSNAVDKALGDGEASCALMYSCISRGMTLGAGMLDEFDMLRNKCEALPMFAAFSGGEMCPTSIGGEHAINRFHNNAFICCII